MITNILLALVSIACLAFGYWRSVAVEQEYFQVFDPKPLIIATISVILIWSWRLFL